MMRINCIKTVKVSGRTVYSEGENYEYSELIENGKLTGHKVNCSSGTGVWLVGDPTFKEYFEEAPKAEKAQAPKKQQVKKSEKPKKKSKVSSFMNLFKK